MPTHKSNIVFLLQSNPAASITIYALSLIEQIAKLTESSLYLFFNKEAVLHIEQDSHYKDYWQSLKNTYDCTLAFCETAAQQYIQIKKTCANFQSSSLTQFLQQLAQAQQFFTF